MCVFFLWRVRVRARVRCLCFFSAPAEPVDMSLISVPGGGGLLPPSTEQSTAEDEDGDADYLRAPDVLPLITPRDEDARDAFLAAGSLVSATAAGMQPSSAHVAAASHVLVCFPAHFLCSLLSQEKEKK